MDNDKNALTRTMSSTQNIVHTLESQLSKANKTVSKQLETVADKDYEIRKLKLLLEQSEKSLHDLRLRYEEKVALLGEFEDKNNDLHDDIGKFFS